MNIFCPLVAPLAEKINFSPKQKFSEFQRICHIYVSNWALWMGNNDIFVQSPSQYLFVHATICFFVHPFVFSLVRKLCFTASLAAELFGLTTISIYYHDSRYY